VHIETTVRRVTPNQGERGFTLIEVMITLGVLSVGLLGLVGMQLVATKGVQNSAETSLATNLATSNLDELTLVDFATLQASGIPGFPKKYDKQGTDVTVSGASPYFTVKASYVTAGSTYVDVKVSTEWTNELDDTLLRTITMLGRIRQRGQLVP
jgi:uncharacterized protein (TIGR02598 family)